MHQRTHELAAHLLITADAGNSIFIYDYDNFTNSLERLQLEILALRRELEGMLYSRDLLTDSVGRIDMLPMLREQWELVKRQVIKSSCIVMMDLDHFKNINDLYGHSAGDVVLSAAVHYVIENLRSYDKVFRYGGEEFLLCIQNTELTSAYEMIERLREGLAITDINIGTQAPVHISASFGLTLLDPDISVEQSIDRADKAMYAAKSAGRNCTRIWEPSMGTTK